MYNAKLKRYRKNLSLIISFIMLFTAVFSMNIIRAEEAKASSHLFDFENGDLNGFKLEGDKAKISSDNTYALTGKSSLKYEAIEEGEAKIKIDRPEGVRKGDKLTFNIYLPAGSGIISVRPFYKINDIITNRLSLMNMVNDNWFQIELPISDDDVKELGFTIKAQEKGDVYFDSIDVVKYNEIIPLEIHSSKKLGGGLQLWGWGNGTDVEYSYDKTVLYKATPSLKIHQIAAGWGWQIPIVHNSYWTAVNYAQYYDNGYLEFEATGLNGGEKLRVSVADVGASIEIGDGNVVGKNGQQTKWQHFAIPMKSLMSSKEKNGNMIVFQAAGSEGDKTVYFNNIRITGGIEKSLAPIVVNQVGYFPDSVKQAKISAFSEDIPNIADGAKFSVKNAINNEEVYSGKIKLEAEYDQISGEKVFNADFTALKTTGEYYIEIEGISQKSYNFKIGKNIYEKLINDALKYFYYQRSGTDIRTVNAGKFAHKAFFMGEYSAPMANEMNLAYQSSVKAEKPVYRNVEGLQKGWFENGGFGKFVDGGAYAIRSLLYAFESYPSMFKDNVGIPESGNNRPDVLDEIRWELDFILSMQEDTTGGFYHSVVEMNTNPFKQDEFEKAKFKRYITDLGTKGEQMLTPTGTTANAVASLAQAARIFRQYDPKYSQKLTDAAKKGWEFLKSNTNSTGVSKSTLLGNIMPYSGIVDDRDLRINAAATLFRLTGEKEFDDFVLANYKQFVAKTYVVGKANANDLEGDLKALNNDYFAETPITNIRVLPLYNYMVSKGANPEVSQFFKTYYNDYEKVLINRILNSPWQNSSNGNFISGSNSNMTNVTFQLDMFGQMFGTYSNDSKKAIISNTNFSLGLNPLRFSFIAGYGSDYVTKINSKIYSNDVVENEIPAGYMGKGLNKVDYQISKFPGRCYADGNNVESNDNNVTTNANLVSAISAAIAAGNNISSKIFSIR